MTYEYTGYESAFVPTPPSDDPKVERKTENSRKSENKDKKEEKETPTFVSSGQKSVLSAYRSYTYNFTLSSVYKSDINKPENYKKSVDELIILKSGGKGFEGILNPSQEQIKTAEGNYKTSTDKNYSQSAQERKKGNLEKLEMVQGFNKDSPGRFDMFIENVEIETIMAFTKQGGTTQPTKIKFDVIEPYSLNGFIEALHVASVKAGFPNYIAGSYLLKIEFIGYPDNDELTDPEVIPKSTRYFLIRITGLEVEVTERGTRYQVGAVPLSEKVYGQAGKLKKSVKIVGENVREVLEDLMLNMTDQEIQNSKKSKNEPNYDEYQVKFLKQSGTGWVDDRFGTIASSKLAELGVDSNLYQMVDPAENKKKNNYKIANERPGETETVKEEIPYEPKKSVTQFPENVNIHEIIMAVIRDSEYVSNIIKDMPIDPDGFVEYFSVRVEVANKSGINPKTKEPNQIFTYIVSPFRIHFTSIPNLGSVKSSEKKLKKSTLREYNYIYTGLNTEVKNFRLNFNSLYFEAVPTEMGKKDKPGAQNAARPGGGVQPTYRETGPSSVSSVPESSKRTDPTATSVLPPSGYNAGLPKTDPFSVLARTMHEKILNSVSLLTGELEIIGDPLYLVTGGIGNYSPSMVNHLETADGEVAHIRGQVLIAINFRNPIDINSFEKGGMMYFDSNRIPFSGVYQVLTVINSFQQGQFNQKLSVTRVPGQIIDQNIEPQDPRDLLVLTPDPLDQVKTDTTLGLDFGERIDSSTLEEQLGRGVPNPGIPGELVNFTDSPGGLGGDDPALKSQLFGSFNINQGLQSFSSQVGLPLPDDFSRNIRLSQQGIADLSQFNLENASKVKTTVDTLFQSAVNSEYSALSQNLTSNYITKNALNQLQGSGIGEGATNFINSEDLNISADAFSYTPGISKNLNQLNVSAVTNLTKQGTGKILNSVNDKLGALLGSRADPLALASRVNLDSSKISGLGSYLSSKVSNQINEFSNVPEDTNLTQQYQEGLRLEYISPSKLTNLPPTQPQTSAPPPQVNLDYVNSVAASYGAQGLANLYGVNSVEKISRSLISRQDLNSSLENVSASQFNPLKNFRKDINQFASDLGVDKLVSAKDQLNPLVGDPLIRDTLIAGAVASKFNSKSLGKNPLDKLVSNVGNTKAAVYTGNNPVIRKNLGLPKT